ncbi:MAG: HNH endonuclease [Mycobacteriales bacterium]
MKLFTVLLIVAAAQFPWLGTVDPTSPIYRDNQRAQTAEVIYGSINYRTRRGVVLNSLALTPGQVRMTAKADICSTRTPGLRKVTAKTKRAVFHAYGIDCSRLKCGQEYEVDHLISLEIGGSNDLSNLWPQPYDPPGARQKDVLENKLHAMICSGQISPARAQKEIAEDWWRAYGRYVKKSDAKLGR